MLEVHHRNIAVLLIIAILLGSGFWMLKRFHRSTTIATLIFGPPDFIVGQPTITQQSDSAQMQVLTSSHRQITAHIIGAVKQPDVFRLLFPAYLNDFVSAAGGFTDRANLNGLNLAQIVYDGDQVVIPTRTQNPNSGDQTGAHPSAFLVKPNKSKLMSQPLANYNDSPVSDRQWPGESSPFAKRTGTLKPSKI